MNFRLLGFPVRVHPYFWLVSLIMGAGSREPLGIAIWIAVVFVSILVHELGHALAFRRFGRPSHILLHGMGGLCIPDERMSWDYAGEDERPWSRMFILFAGPLAGFLLAAAILGVIFVWARLHGIVNPLAVQFSLQNAIHWEFHPAFWDVAGYLGIVTLHDLLFVNIYWGLVNLLPVYPLDGGQMSREMFCLYSRGDGVRESLILSIVTAVAIAAWAGYQRDVYLVLMFGLLAFNSYQALQQHSGYGYQKF